MKTIITSWGMIDDNQRVLPDESPVSKMGFSISTLSATQTSDFGKSEEMEFPLEKDKLTFHTNLACWNNQTYTSSNNNLDNPYFQAIIDMGQKAIPFIKAELEKGPTMLVYALQQILPGVIEPKGYLPLPILCSMWLNQLQKI